MGLAKDIWTFYKALFYLLRHARELPTDAQLRAAGVEPDHTPYIPPWAVQQMIRQGQHHHHHFR